MSQTSDRIANGFQPTHDHPADGLAPDAIVESIGLPVIATTPAGTIVTWNRAAASLYGHSSSDAVGRNIVELLVPSPLGPQAADIMATVANGDRWRGDFVVTRADGSAVQVHVVDSPVLDERGEIVGIVGLGRDITDELLTEQALSDSRDALRLALAAGRLGTWRWEMATGAVIWDEQLEGLFGLPPGAFDNTFATYQSLLHPEDRAHVLEVVNGAVAEKADYEIEHRVVWPDGTVHWLEGRGSITLDDDGAVTGTTGCIADITDSVQRRAQTVELSATLQAGLLPTLVSPPDVAVHSRYRPGEERLLLAGDFLDVAVTPGGDIGFCIGDVAGHGAFQAAVGASLRAGWRALALTGDDPQAWLAGCARLLAASEPPPELFVTMVTGLISADRRHATFLTAGHPPPILLDESGATTLDLSPAPPLGLLATMDAAPAHTVDLPDRWSLILFTDGLFEGSDASGTERLGAHAIEQWCARRRPPVLDEQALDDLLAYVQGANGAPIVDDIAVLALVQDHGRASRR